MAKAEIRKYGIEDICQSVSVPALCFHALRTRSSCGNSDQIKPRNLEHYSAWGWSVGSIWFKFIILDIGNGEKVQFCLFFSIWTI